MGRTAAGIVSFALWAGLMASSAAQTPTQLSPPASAPTPPAAKPVAKPVPSKPAATQSSKPAPTQTGPVSASPRRDLDMAYGAFQRGHYVTAFAIATQRVEEQKDVKAMTLLGELYANGLGVERDDKKAAEWYGQAVERGDREAMFALAMLQLAGRTGNREQGAQLLAAAAKLGHAVAAYDLALLYIEGQMFPQDFGRAAELFRSAAQVGLPEAQYALATLYKEGRGVEKDLTEAVRLLAAASRADNTDAQVEYAIALFNGTGGAERNERLAATLLAKAARKGNPIAQNRLANILAVGRGLQANAVEAVKWHIVAKAGGVSDIPLDTFVQKQTPEIREAGEKAAKPWLDALKEQRESRT
jgi:TPR repeat protein